MADTIAATTAVPVVATADASPPTVTKEWNGVPSGFVLKLFQMVNGAPDEVISWVPCGDAFKISDLHRLETETLPIFFRHNRFQSLVRQLNFYNFRKVNRERNFWVYRHPLFHRDRPNELHLLRRRTCPGVDGRKHRLEVGSGSLTELANAISKTPPSIANGAALNNGEGLNDKPETADSGKQPKRKSFTGDKIVDDTAIQAIKLPTIISPPHVVPPPKVLKREPTDSPSSCEAALLCNMKGSVDHVATPEVVDKKFSLPVLADVPLDLPSGLHSTIPSRRVSYSERQHPLLGSLAACAVANAREAETDTNRSERRDHHRIVSQVAQELDEHLKRSAVGLPMVNNQQCRRGRHRRGGNISPLTSAENMKYTALTYDLGAGDSSALISVQGTEGAALVTDVDDNGDDDVTSSLTSSVSDISLKSSPSDMTPASLSAPVENAAVIAAIERKLLVAASNPSVFSCAEDGTTTAAVAAFCMSTPPQHPMFQELASKLMGACSELNLEFQRYRSALQSRNSYTNHQPLLQPFGQRTVEDMTCDEAVRDFKIFLVNRLDALKNHELIGAIGLETPENDAIRQSGKIWFDSVSATA